MYTCKVKIKYRQILYISIFIIAVHGCRPSEPEIIRDFYPGTQLIVSPSPNESVGRSSIDGNAKNRKVETHISVEFNNYEAFRYVMGVKFGQHSYDPQKDLSPSEKAYLYIDDRLISSKQAIVLLLGSLIEVKAPSGIILYKGSGYMKIEWKVSLPRGEHTARFRLTREDGKHAQEYKWSFTVVGEK